MSTIPFDHPSLVLGNVVNESLLQMLTRISRLQNRTDAAQEKVSSYIIMKRSIEMTMSELMDMNVDTEELSSKIQDIDTAIQQAASAYISVKLDNDSAIQDIKEQISNLEPDTLVESPLDLVKSAVIKLPLSADSLKMDAQYFSYEDTDESQAGGQVSTIEKYIKETTAELGNKASNDLAKTASGQIKLQKKNHNLSGTLIIIATCNHKNAKLLEPCVIDPDKAASVWNRLFPDDTIQTNDAATLNDLVEDSGQKKFITLISGANYGSSFIGMVHILKEDITRASQASLTDLAAQLQDRLTVGSWLKEASGGFGTDPALLDDVRNLLGGQRVSSHVNLVVMGASPSIRSNALRSNIQPFSDFSTEKLNTSLAAINNASSADQNSVNQAATAAKTGAKVMAIQNATLNSFITGLNQVDQAANKMIDINSMMTAFENYLQETKLSDSGIPISFFLKTLSKSQITKLYKDKYYPAIPSKDNPSSVNA